MNPKTTPSETAQLITKDDPEKGFFDYIKDFFNPTPQEPPPKHQNLINFLTSEINKLSSQPELSDQQKNLLTQAQNLLEKLKNGEEPTQEDLKLITDIQTIPHPNTTLTTEEQNLIHSLKESIDKLEDANSLSKEQEKMLSDAKELIKKLEAGKEINIDDINLITELEATAAGVSVDNNDGSFILQVLYGTEGLVLSIPRYLGFQTQFAHKDEELPPPILRNETISPPRNQFFTVRESHLETMGAIGSSYPKDMMQTMAQGNLLNNAPVDICEIAGHTITAIDLSSGMVTIYLDVNGMETSMASAIATIKVILTGSNKGDFKFNLLDNVDHSMGDVTLNIPFSYQQPGAPAKTMSDLDIGIIDDAPIPIEELIMGTVDEDGVLEGIADGGEGDGIPGGTDDVMGENTMVTLDISPLFIPGADDPLSFAFVSNAESILTNLNLTSRGLDLDYSLMGTTITASTSYGDVFTINLSTTGMLKFTLIDQLDHADGMYENNLLIMLGAIVQATDTDGSSATAFNNTIVIDVDDDTPTNQMIYMPLVGAVDEDKLPGGIEGGPGDIDAGAGTVGLSTTTNIKSLFRSGADEPLTYSLCDTGITASDGQMILNLESDGVALVYALSNNNTTLTATAGAMGPVIFTATINPTTGDYTFTLFGPLDHPIVDFEDDIYIDLSATIQAQDYDKDPIKGLPGTFIVTVDDDVPDIIKTSNIYFKNDDNNGCTGDFEYSIGADSRNSYSNVNSDFMIGLTGTVATQNIANPSVTWVSENDTAAVFSFSFDYQADPSSAALTTATGTLTFDKTNGTYSVTLNNAVEGLQILVQSEALNRDEYNLIGMGASQPEVVVSEFSSDFFAQFSGDIVTKGKMGVALTTGGDTVFTNGEIFKAAQTYITVTNVANGVNNDAIHKDEVFDMNFFTSDPGGTLTSPGTATTSTIFFEIDDIGTTEDLIVLLKLYDSGAVTSTTKVIVVSASEILRSGDTLPTYLSSYDVGGSHALNGNDGLVIIDPYDYNAMGENYLITGAQLLSSTDSISGTGIELEGTAGSAGASDTSSNFITFGVDYLDDDNNTANTVDNDVVKIKDIGVISTSTQPLETILNFNVKVIDNDGDPTDEVTITANLTNNLVGADGDIDEHFCGTSGDDFFDGMGGQDTYTGNGGNDTFVVADNDIITDFSPGAGPSDVLQIAGGLTLAAMLGNGSAAAGEVDAITSGSNTLIGISDGAGGLVGLPLATLEGILPGDLSPDDFSLI